MVVYLVFVGVFNSFCSEATVKELRCDETDCCELLDEDNIQDLAQANCSSTMETIFSPIPETVDNASEATTSDDRGSETDHEAPSLGSNDSDSSNRNLCEYQSCNVSDFFISDMIVSSSPYTEATCLPDFGCDESFTFSDDDFMLLPFLEDSFDTCNESDDSINRTGSGMVSEESNLYMAIHQLRSCNPEIDSDVNTYPEWDPAECLDPQMFIRNLPDLSELETNVRHERKTVTLVLDLDETLVHSSLEYCDDADFTFPVFVDLREYTVYVKKRPHLREFLERVSEMFQVFIFTASQSIYAKQLLDVLDPDGKIISHRAYRESCVFVDGCYTKDLTVLGVDLAKVAIVDNCPQVFRLQVNNGIPIKSWFSDPSDCALISLLPFLERLADAEDVRPIIAKRFGFLLGLLSNLCQIVVEENFCFAVSNEDIYNGVIQKCHSNRYKLTLQRHTGGVFALLDIRNIVFFILMNGIYWNDALYWKYGNRLLMDVYEMRKGYCE
ncbi:HAD-like domain protein [Tanacetum coccineum]